MGEQNVIMWLIFLAALSAAGFWHYRENIRIIRQSRDKPQDYSSNWLKRFVWNRSLQVLIVLLSAFAVIIGYDWHLKDAENQINTLQQEKSVMAQELAVLKKPLENVEYYPPEPAPGQPDPVPLVIEQPDIEEVATPLEEIPAEPVTLKDENVPEAVDEPNNSANIMDEVYNPEKTSGDRQSVMDDIKKRYEDILVTYMFLKKCRRVNVADYHVITSALGQEMASVNAPGRLQYDILTAAQGSYKEMYAQSRCDGESINALETQYVSYIKTLSDNTQLK